MRLHLLIHLSVLDNPLFIPEREKGIYIYSLSLSISLSISVSLRNVTLPLLLLLFFVSNFFFSLYLACRILFCSRILSNLSTLLCFSHFVFLIIELSFIPIISTSS